MHNRTYGGNFQETQLQQNLLAMELLGNSTTIQMLDVSPIMLARGDASSDETHFCLYRTNRLLELIALLPNRAKHEVVNENKLA